MARKDPAPAALTESALLEVGLRVGDRVRWQRTTGGSWQEATVERLVHLGALGVVTRLGGRVQVPPFDTSYGNVAVVTDNQGASFALLQRRAGGDWREASQEEGQEEQVPDDLRLEGDERREDEG